MRWLWRWVVTPNEGPTTNVLIAVAHGWVRGRRDRERVVHRGSNVTVHPTAYDQDGAA
jgi:hypothetical protein